MSLARIHTRALVGVDAPPVLAEVHLSNGLPGMSIVGLPEAAVRESRDRVRAALMNSGFEFPQRKITCALAPADLPKEGGSFDLPIALGILAATGQVPQAPLEHLEFLGELSLAGELRGARGVLPALLAARSAGRRLVLPRENLPEASLAGRESALGASDVMAVGAFLHGRAELSMADETPLITLPVNGCGDLIEVRGQLLARRALEVAAAGAHNLLFVGPPGTGKTMLASRLPGILPAMSDAEALESAAIASVGGDGRFAIAHFRRRPFRSPHHTASAIALVGGGSNPRPGEISLAHHGVLFLDELPEWDRHVLEVLREPLESGRIVISRAARQAEFPARFQLVAAMNPCPCGYAGDPNGRCHCSLDVVQRYRSRISGPLLDRIDLQIHVPRLPPTEWRTTAVGESSDTVRARVEAARQVQMSRAGKPNAQLDPHEVERDCHMGAAELALLERSAERLGLSARAYGRILKLARTLADLDRSDRVSGAHLAEALSLRRGLAQ